jgi:CRISPR-associated protein Cmr4
MKELSSLVFLYAETPLHAGSGAALGAVDLPVQRERMSGLPMVQGSGIKGALRAELKGRHQNDKDWEIYDRALFGREPPGKGESAEKERDKDKAGALSLLDARLLLLPVRTVWGGFAWVTSPMILQRLARDLEIARIDVPPWHSLQSDDDKARIGTRSSVVKGTSFIIEDLEYDAASEPLVDKLAEWLVENALPSKDGKNPTAGYEPFGKRLAPQLAVVGDAEMKLLSEHATEVVTRVRIDHETGTVADGALWTEESLPAETLLWSLAFFAEERPSREQQASKDKQDKDKPMDEWKPRGAEVLRKKLHAETQAMTRIRLGGDRTVGRGIVGIRLRDGGAS